MLEFLVENPPVEVVVMEWHTASKSDIPPIIRAIVYATVSARYMIPSFLAVSAIFGDSFSLVGPAISAPNIIMPLNPNRGSSASDMTIIPMPPVHCVSALQNNMLWHCASTSVMTLAPTVVNPDMVSKRASVTFYKVPVSR